MKYGCVRWQPALPDGDTDNTVEQAGKQLCTLYETDPESTQIAYLMDMTFPFQRSTINAGCQ